MHCYLSSGIANKLYRAKWVCRIPVPQTLALETSFLCRLQAEI